MLEISLHILDVIQNSVTAGATRLTLWVYDLPEENRLAITLQDNGKGMDKEFLSSALAPYSTTRKTRSMGLGLSLFAAAAERTDGHLTLVSTPGQGTTVSAIFGWHHIDRQPLGNMADTIISALLMNPSIDIVYRHITAEKEFLFDSQNIKNAMKCGSLTDPSTITQVRRHISDNLRNLQQA